MAGRVFEIVSVGNELLSGRTVNTNASWLASRITGIGGIVRRMTTVGDDLDEISSAVREAIERGSSWIITTGGLGPTFDDMTLEGVAKALGIGLELDEEAVRMIKERYREMEERGIIHGAELTPARLKMAKLPKGSVPLRNPVGTAPGVMLKRGEATIFCLPGVPKEMKAIFEMEVEPIIRRGVKGIYRVSRVMRITGIVESELSPIIDEVMGEVGGVFIKSHPSMSGEGVSVIELEVHATRPSREEAERWVEMALNSMRDRLKGRARCEEI